MHERDPRGQRKTHVGSGGGLGPCGSGYASPASRSSDVLNQSPCGHSDGHGAGVLVPLRITLSFPCRSLRAITSLHHQCCRRSTHDEKRIGGDGVGPDAQRVCGRLARGVRPDRRGRVSAERTGCGSRCLAGRDAGIDSVGPGGNHPHAAQALGSTQTQTGSRWTRCDRDGGRVGRALVHDAGLRRGGRERTGGRKRVLEWVAARGGRRRARPACEREFSRSRARAAVGVITCRGSARQSHADGAAMAAPSVSCEWHGARTLRDASRGSTCPGLS